MLSPYAAGLAPALNDVLAGHVTMMFNNQPNVLQLVRHLRYGDAWNNLAPPETFVADVRAGDLPSVSWLIPPWYYNEHPWRFTDGSGNSVCAGAWLNCSDFIDRMKHSLSATWPR